MIALEGRTRKRGGVAGPGGKKVSNHFMLSPWLTEALREIADREEVSNSQLVHRIFEEWLMKNHPSKMPGA